MVCVVTGTRHPFIDQSHSSALFLLPLCILWGRSIHARASLRYSWSSPHTMSPHSGSGKHTPEATGDFAEFLQAEELKAKLAEEQEAEAKRELKAAKNAKRQRDSGIGGGGLGGRGKPETPEERWRRRQAMASEQPEFVPDQPTLEERRHFPGDLLHHGHLAVRKTPNTARLGTHPKHASTNSSPIMRIERLRPPGICGPVSDSEEEEEAEEEEEHGEGGDDGMFLRPSTSLGRSSSIFDRALRRRSGDTARAGPGRHSLPVSRRNSDASKASSVDSYASSAIAEPYNAPPQNPSVISLKSFESDRTGDGSLASGGANRKLARPLLELEELELESFLKNFGRHTREVRVPHSANFPQRRMPRWEDFKVPPGEAALASAQGKRVTVLTHVDRGLKALERAEGEGVPLARGAAEADDVEAAHEGKDHHHHHFFHSSKKKDKDKKKDEKGSAPASEYGDQTPASTATSPVMERKPSSVTSHSQGRQTSKGSPAGQSTAVQPRPSNVSPPSSSTQPRVSWAPHPTIGLSFGSSSHGKQQSQSTSVPTDYSKRPATPEGPQLGGLNRNSLEKDERLAKKQDQADQKSAGPSALAQHGGPIDIHDEHTEWRPSRDEANLNEEEWELLHGPHEEVQVNAQDDDSQVDGIAWAIAYILATIERYAPEELDNTPDQTYRESRTRSHIERLYLIAPFWERLLFGIRRVYRWDNPRRTSTFAMIYFTLWYMDLIPTAFMLTLMYYVCQFRFFPPSASYLHEQVRARMARGVDADRLAERLRRRSRLDVLEIYKRFVIAYGPGTQLAFGDIADFHEKVKNLILWRNPTATWRTLFLLGIATTFVTFASSHLIWKTVYAFLGFTFFILLPLQSHYPRFRRPLSPIWWALWGAPTDAQFAIQLLRRRHLERQFAKHPPQAHAEGANAGPSVMNDHKNQRSPSDLSSEKSNGLKGRFLRSSAAHAVAYGALRPFRGEGGYGGLGANDPNAEQGNLLDLQDVKVLDGGQILSKPRKLGSFFCQHHGVPGHLHVTTRMIYFVALHSHATSGAKGGRKTCKTLLSEISGMVKTKSIKLLVWNSSGLQITRRNKSSLFFSNMPHRDNAFNLLLAVGSEGKRQHCQPTRVHLLTFYSSLSLSLASTCLMRSIH